MRFIKRAYTKGTPVQRVQRAASQPAQQVVQPYMTNGNLLIPRERSNATPGPMDSPYGNVGYPGGQLGAPIEVVRDLVKKQQRMKGFDFIIPVAAAGTRFNINGLNGINNLAGKIFLGLNFMSDSPLGAVFSREIATLIINDEVIFTDMEIVALQTSVLNIDYVSYPRPLSGQDKINIEIVLQAAVLVACAGQVQIWYI